ATPSRTWQVIPWSPERPRASIPIERPFEIQDAPLTRGQYTALLGEPPFDESANSGGRRPLRIRGHRIQCPDCFLMMWVGDLLERIPHLQAKLGELHPEYEYGLPTLTQWTFAATDRSRADRPPWADPQGLLEYGWFQENRGGTNQHLIRDR